MADLNIIEKANKVLTFRKYIREECRKKGLEYPSDDKICEYIADCGGDECVYDLNDFMSDYETKDGVFRDPFVDFKAEIDKYSWVNKPTEEEMREYISKNGYNVKGFLRQHTINSYNPLERDTLLSTLKKCTIPQLVALWNEFIEEATIYGADSHIYDLKDENNVCELRKSMCPSEWAEVHSMASRGIRYVSWHNLNDGNILSFNDEDIKGAIIAYWSDIFPRFLTWTCECYNDLGKVNTDGRYRGFYDDVIRPVLLKALGYNYDPSRGIVEEIKKD